MMRRYYRCQSGTGKNDVLEVESFCGNLILVTSNRDDEDETGPEVFLDRDQVANLRTYLTRWLEDGEATPAGRWYAP